MQFTPHSHDRGGGFSLPVEQQTYRALAQVGSRAERMGMRECEEVFLYSATRLADILAEIIAMRPRGVIVDSIQTVYLDDVTGSAGSVSQANLLTMDMAAQPAFSV